LTTLEGLALAWC